MASRPESRKTEEAPGILEQVPVALQVAGAWAWRLLAVGVVLIALFTVLARLSALVVPIAIALLIAAPLGTFVSWLARHGFSRGWAAIITLLSLVAFVLGLIAVASTTVIGGLDKLKHQASDGLHTLIHWLSSGPLHLSADQIQSYLDKAGQALRDNSSGIAARAMSVGSTVGLLTAGAILALFCLFFFLRDGRKIWLDMVQVFPARARGQIDYAGVAAWETLALYSRTSLFVAIVSAVGIGLGAWILGLSLWVPIFIVVFLTSFIPLLGATFSGVVAVLVAVVEGGWVKAVIMVGIVLVVHLLVGNVLYPLLFGKAASVHPIVILLAIGVGGIVGGALGALLGVPILMATMAFVKGLRETGMGPTTEIPISGIGGG